MTPTHGPRIAAIYARVSTTEQADKGWSLPTQLEACVTLARAAGIYRPLKAISSRTTIPVRPYNRPQFLKLRELVRQRLVSAVIVHDLDRLSRKLAHQLLLSEEFEQAGVTLHIVTMPDGEKTPETQLLANVRGSIAEYERAKFLERSKRGLRGRAQAGFTPGGAVPLGYRAVQHAKGTSYVIAPEEAALVQHIFSMYVGSGHSLGAIALQLTQEGIVPPGTRRSSRKLTLSTATWHKTTVRDILRSATYLGTVYYGKTTNLPGKSNPDKKTRHGTAPQSEWIAVPVPPIIDETIFQAAQQQLRINAEQSKRNRKHEYLFTGKMLRCRQCEASMGGVINGQGLRHYRCNRPPYQRQDRPHRRRNVKASALEPVVWQAVETALRNPALIAQAVERRRQDMQSGQGDLERERCSYEVQTGPVCQRFKTLGGRIPGGGD